MYRDLIEYWHQKINIISWKKKPTTILKKIKNRYSWFTNGELNIYSNCVIKNLKKNRSKTAVIFVNKDQKIKKLSYDDLYNGVENFSKIIDTYKKKKIFKVAIHASASPESVISMLACCKMSVIFTVIFEDLPSDSILTRLNIFKPDLFISRTDTDNLKNNILKVLEKYKKISKKKIELIYFSQKKNIINNDCININDLISKKKLSSNIRTIFSKSDESSFVLFTSGSTGEPKGIEHSIGGYFLYAKYSCKKQFGMNKDSIVLTASDAGWINGHTYALFGPLSFGATTVILEKPLMFIDENLIKRIIYNFKTTILYLPVTIIRILRATTQKNFSKRNNIKALGSMGEPLAKDVAKWFSDTFTNGKLSIVNTYFQTETGGIICSPKYNDRPSSSFHGTVGKSINKYIKLNIDTVKKNKDISQELKILNPWPGCMKSVINGKKVYNNYWDKDGSFKLFDIGKKDKNNNLLVLGRSDDVMNVRGHRIGSGELEDQVLTLKEIKECCAVSSKDELEGEKINIFISLKKKDLHYDIKKKVSLKIIDFFGIWAKPKEIYILSELPKTRSGKILRRLLRYFLNEDKVEKIDDLSTIINPSIINEIKLITKSLNDY